MNKLNGLAVVFGMLLGVGCVGGATTEAGDEVEAAGLSEQRAPEAIQATVRESFDELRNCYEEALGRDPQLSGKIMLEFTIDLDGSTVDLSIGQDSTLDDEALHACMLAVASDLEFEEAAITTTVSYPIAFTPN